MMVKVNLITIAIVIGVILIAFGVDYGKIWLTAIGAGFLGGGIGFMYNDLKDRDTND